LGREHVRPSMLDLILGGAVAIAIAVYLVYALLYPEKL
jgi:K+-transporting ATPase KdpF subunit